MNERIRELMEQAKAESSQWLGSKPATTITYDELEKFAELIVEECLDILEDEDDGEIETRSVRIAAIRIKKLFGVEE